MQALYSGFFVLLGLALVAFGAYVLLAAPYVMQEISALLVVLIGAVFWVGGILVDGQRVAEAELKKMIKAIERRNNA